TLTVAYVLCSFFQAEDGIRDLIVTGVQTCALPISDPYLRLADGIVRAVALVYSPEGAAAAEAGRGEQAIPEAAAAEAGRGEQARSEERRVGKEWRWWWAAEGAKNTGAAWA